MKRQFPCLFLAGVLCLSLSACGPRVSLSSPAPSPEVPDPIPTQAVPTQSPAPEPFAVPGSFPEAASLPLGRYAPWQKDYMEFLSQLCRQEQDLRQWAENATSAEVDADPERWAAYNLCSDSYWLYDVDKDGVPELFIRYGNSEAAYETVCYTYREDSGQPLEVGRFPAGHSTLLTYPEDNGFLLYWAHMGAAHVDRYTLEEGGLVNQGQVFGSDLDAAQQEDYPTPEKIHPGSALIPSAYTRVSLRNSLSPALLLPICDYDRSIQQPASLTEEATVRDVIGKVLWDGAGFQSVSGDGYYGEAGRMTLEEFIQPGAGYPYSSSPLEVRELAWADANGDGLTDCILRLRDAEQGDASQFYLVLSLQEEQVYGYFFAFLEEPVVDPDGTVYFQAFGQWQQVSFYKEQCYACHSPAPVVGDGLVWDSFH